ETVGAGSQAIYTLTVDNLGPATAQNVTVTDTLPTGLSFVSASDGGSYNPTTGEVSWDLGSVAEPDPPRDLTVSVHADGGQNGDVDNNAAVHRTTSDPNQGNDGVTVTTHISPGADLSISKSAGTAVAGGKLDYTITVVNNGPATAQNVVVTDALPAG